MDNKEIVKQMIDFHKASFENCFSMMVTLQGQAERLLNTFVDQTPGISDESKKVVNQWSGAYKKGIDDLRKAMDEGYSKAEIFFNNNAIVKFQDQAEKMFNSYLNQVNWMPPDLKKTLGELAATYKKSCDEFNKYVEENIWRMSTFSSFNNKSPKKTKSQK
jgi:hypothetical protein